MQYFFNPDREYQDKIRLLKRAQEYPVYECLINLGWQEMGHARVLLARELPNSNLVFGVYMVDVYCLGLKDTFCNVDFTKPQYETEIKSIMFFDQQPIECDINLAHTIIYGGIEYAKKLGFLPQSDFKQSKYILEPESQVGVDKSVKFGRQGKPFYVPGPDDDVKQVIYRLKQNVGEGNFDFMCEVSMMDDLDEDDESDGFSGQNVGRNDPCPCGSGKKFKRCCGIKVD